jgi:uncharacterized protein YoxC
MKRWAVPLAASVAIALAALYLTFFRKSDEERIRRVLDELAKTVAVKQGDTILSRTARLRSKLPELVDPDVRVDVEELKLVAIKVDPHGTVAQADAIALVSAKRGDERNRDRRKVHFLLRRDGDWTISTIEVAVAREPPP